MLTTDFTGHLALVTGGTGGIGRSTCLALASLGCSVAVHYHSAADTASELVEQIERMGEQTAGKQQIVKAKAFQANLATYDDARRLHAEVVSQMGPPTILFNNAGLTQGKSGLKKITDVSIEDFEKTWRANCGSSFLLTQLCIPAMEDKGWGRVIFCSSVAGFTGGVVGPHYASSKSALHGLVHWLAGAYAAKGITVNAVAPALIQETRMLPGDNEVLANKIPVGVLGRPEEIAETVVWIVKTGYLTNKVIGVDGGMFPQ